MYFAYEIPINRFPETQEILNKTPKTWASFSYCKKIHRELCDCESNIDGVVATVFVKLDLNETRISHRLNLAH